MGWMECKACVKVKKDANIKKNDFGLNPFMMPVFFFLNVVTKKVMVVVDVFS